MQSDQTPPLYLRTKFAFRSAKARMPIPAATAFAHNVLVTATLDPAVRSIVASDHEAATADLLMTNGDRMRLLVDEDGTLTAGWSPDQRAGYRIVTRREDDSIMVRAILVWGCRRRHVTYDDHLAIVAHLKRAGSTRLGDLFPLVTSYIAPLPAILGLACRDVVEVDLREVPGVEMTVRLRERGTED